MSGAISDFLQLSAVRKNIIPMRPLVTTKLCSSQDQMSTNGLPVGLVNNL